MTLAIISQNVLSQTTILIVFRYNKYIKPKIKGKGTIDRYDINNTSCKIDCKDCDAIYIGVTTSALEPRKKKHASCIKNKDEKAPPTVNHINTGHNFNIESTRFNDKVHNNYTLKFSEMLHIHYHDNTIN
ncbi:hypothetical protein TSAR_016211 [Trichomalopsis sarcophagae]|uniref:GIY-YIG domain-containing protein n=1 Tax=Trichomalopsis sarcophagae TaxID=543379 RepID=A0A232EHE2_9HYME|nr:hypothetical protein TSAR_016211 [Trichomalopsis sarcophagae]